MRKLIAIFFLFLMIGSQINFFELVKFKNLFVHYVEHKTDDSTIGMVEFLVMHYIQKQIIDDDYEKDVELPFKSNHEHTVNCNIELFATNLNAITAILNKDLFKPYKHSSLYQNNYTYHAVSSFWRPPCIF